MATLSLVEAHGINGAKAGWAMPRLVSHSDAPCRADQHNMLPSDEFLDEPAVLAEKIAAISALVRQSSFCTAYCGAGLSSAAGIADYASDPRKTTVRAAARAKTPFDAQPTLGHRVLAALERAGRVKELIQQNHDGLPQKAGFPQAKINEIHGALQDPSNPVVQFNGSLRNDLFEWLLATEERTDLVLCLGTSLSGMNADRVASSAARRFAAGGGTKQHGLVIINLQRTHMDASSTIRIWAHLDEALQMLAEALQVPVTPLEVAPAVAAKVPGTEVFDVPYTAQGVLDPSVRMRLDLREDAKLVVVAPGSIVEGKGGRVVGRSPDGDFLVGIHKLRPSVWGRWWIEAAVNGAVPRLPLVNETPVVWRVGVDPEPPLPQGPRPIAGDLAFVQSHRLDANGVHNWTLHVEGPDATVDGIRQVVWTLPPHCHAGSITCVDAPFFVSDSERGAAFTVRIEVTFRVPMSGWVLSAEHKLDFDTEGESVKATTVPVSLAEKPSECTIS